MPVSVSGGDGSLEYHAILDTDDFVASAKKLEASLQQTANEAVAANKKIEKSMTDAIILKYQNGE